MREIPIIFSTDMVKAILDSRKTQTRRIIKPQPPTIECKFIGANIEVRTGKIGFYWSDGTSGNMQGFWPSLDKDMYCLYGQPGDLLWVRETFSRTMVQDEEGWFTVYKADGDDWAAPWKPSIHMPKDYARIWLQVKEVRVERLQDITAEDAISEGLENFTITDQTNNQTYYKDYLIKSIGHWYPNPIKSFQSLWVSINGVETWVENPYVWVITFEILSTTGKPNTQANL
jgi:hypothetical protein